MELALLRRSLNARIGRTGLPPSYTASIWGCAALAAAAGWGVKLATETMRPELRGVLVLGAFGLAYVAATGLLRVPEAQLLVGRVSRATRRRR